MSLSDLHELLMGGEEAMVDLVLRERLRATIDKLLRGLSAREKKVLVLRYGLCGKDEHLLSEVGARIKNATGEEKGISRERVRQIEMKALRRLRHPSRRKLLRAIVGYGWERRHCLNHREGCDWNTYSGPDHRRRRIKAREYEGQVGITLLDLFRTGKGDYYRYWNYSLPDRWKEEGGRWSMRETWVCPSTTPEIEKEIELVESSGARLLQR
jgi:hypothetical protein